MRVEVKVTMQDQIERENITVDLADKQLTYGDIQVVKGNLLKLFKKHKIDANSSYGQTWMEFIKQLERKFTDAYDRAMKGL